MTIFGIMMCEIPYFLQFTSILPPTESNDKQRRQAMHEECHAEHVVLSAAGPPRSNLILLQQSLATTGRERVGGLLVLQVCMRMDDCWG